MHPVRLSALLLVAALGLGGCPPGPPPRRDLSPTHRHGDYGAAATRDGHLQFWYKGRPFARAELPELTNEGEDGWMLRRRRRPWSGAVLKEFQVILPAARMPYRPFAFLVRLAYPRYNKSHIGLAQLYRLTPRGVELADEMPTAVGGTVDWDAPPRGRARSVRPEEARQIFPLRVRWTHGEPTPFFEVVVPGEFDFARTERYGWAAVIRTVDRDGRELGGVRVANPDDLHRRVPAAVQGRADADLVFVGRLETVRKRNLADLALTVYEVIDRSARPERSYVFPDAPVSVPSAVVPEP